MTKAKKPKFQSKFFHVIFPCASLVFTLCVFGPLEICANNDASLPYAAYQIIWIFLLVFTAASMLSAGALSLLPKKLFELSVSLVTGVLLASYVQGNFLNTRLDVLDGTAGEWISDVGFLLLNSAIWIIIIALPFILYFAVRKYWKNITIFVSVALILMQGVSLVINFTNEQAPNDTTYYVSNDKFFTLSADENIILIIADTFTNYLVDEALAEYPNALDPYKDFTYYHNCLQTYHATYPAMLSIVTGQKADTALSTRSDVFTEAWTNDYTTSFYEGLKQQGYSISLFSDLLHLCDDAIAPYLGGIINTIQSSDFGITIHELNIADVFLNLSGYRYFPYIMKALLDVKEASFESTYTTYQENSEEIDEFSPFNNRFPKQVLRSEFKQQDESKSFSIYYFYGAHHPNHFDENGVYLKEETTYAQAGMGCLTVIREMLDKMKAADVYDNSTIIITADHGHRLHESWAPVFFYKPAYANQDSIVYSDAPISSLDIVPTIAAVAGLDQKKFGTPIYEIPEHETRVRTTTFRTYNDDFPSNGNETNALVVYSFSGDANDFDQVKDNLEGYELFWDPFW